MLRGFLIACLLVFVAGLDDIDGMGKEYCPVDADFGQFERIGHKLYYFGTSKVSWFRANLICRSLGGYLASIENRQESDSLSNYLLGHYDANRLWWLSGSDLDVESDFHWYGTGKRFDFATWFHPQPDNDNGNEDCVHLIYRSGTYGMNDLKCTSWQNFICESSRKVI